MFLGIAFIFVTLTSLTSAAWTFGNCESCDVTYAPVCGTNGKTYSNRCALDCAQGNVRLLHKGACRAKREAIEDTTCVCPYIYLPVCGTNGKTYGNECALKCEDNVEVAYYGICKNDRNVYPIGERVPAGTDDNCVCPYNYLPVCGTDGQTYPNECSLQCKENIDVAYPGACRQAAKRFCVCPYIYRPVCGSDGQTYGNECSLNCEDNVQVAHHGACSV